MRTIIQAMIARVLLAIIFPATFLLSFSFGQQPNLQLQQATQLLAQQKFAQAEKILTKFLENNRGHAGGSFLLGNSLYSQKKYAAAMEAYETAARTPRFKSAALYNIACGNALTGKPKIAMEKLEQALAAGFNNLDQLENDSDFSSIRKSAKFRELVETFRKKEKLFAEPTRIIHRLNGEAAGDEFGWVARIVGDVDGDDVLDFVATAPSAKAGNGTIYVYSGKTGKQLFSHQGRNKERLGNGAAGAGDVNADQTPDVIIGAPNGPNRGAVYLYSGKDGKLIRKLNAPKSARQFGYKVCSLGDIDDDGHADVFVGAISASGKKANCGVGYAFSGKTGKKIFQVEGERTGDKFGSAVSATMNSKVHLLAVGAQDADVNKRGCVYVYRINNARPKLAFKIQGDANSVNLGQMFVSFPGDVNQDGIPDVYAADFSDRKVAPGAGKIVVHSGADGKKLYEITGQQPGEGLGTSPSEAGDVNGDGIGDLVIGAWQNRSGARSGGRVTLHDGLNGKLLDQWTCLVAGDTFGFDAVGIGDVDGDGSVDFLLTSAWANIRGPKTGRIFVIAGKKYSKQ